jgi:hypothetical protein
VLEALAAVDAPGAVVRESIPHVAVTGVCECGCASFNVRDSRYPAQSHHLAHFANGWTVDPAVGFVLWLGPDGRPISVDVDNEPGVLPDPDSIQSAAPLLLARRAGVLCRPTSRAVRSRVGQIGAPPGPGYPTMGVSGTTS